MFVSWFGTSALKIEYKVGEDTAVLLVDPYTMKGETMPRNLAAQVALFTRGEEDAITLMKEPYTVSNPGEYETSNVAIVGIRNPESKTAPVLYRFSVEELTIGHLGMLDKKLPDNLVAEFDGVDVLFVPVGNNEVISAETAAELVTQIEPRVVVPICFQSGDSGKQFKDVQPFLKELGITNPTIEERARLRKKDLPEDTMLTIVLKPS